MSDHSDVLDGAIGISSRCSNQNPFSSREAESMSCRTVDLLRVGSFSTRSSRLGHRSSSIFEKVSVSIDVAAGNVPAEAARMAESLCLAK